MIRALLPVRHLVMRVLSSAAIRHIPKDHLHSRRALHTYWTSIQMQKASPEPPCQNKITLIYQKAMLHQPAPFTLRILVLANDDGGNNPIR